MALQTLTDTLIRGPGALGDEESAELGQLSGLS